MKKRKIQTDNFYLYTVKATNCLKFFLERCIAFSLGLKKGKHFPFNTVFLPAFFNKMEKYVSNLFFSTVIVYTYFFKLQNFF